MGRTMLEVLTFLLVLCLAGLQLWMALEFKRSNDVTRKLAEIETRELVRGEMLRHETHFHRVADYERT